MTGYLRHNLVLLGGVAVGFALLQLAALGLQYGYEYDEAVYLSQLNPAVPDFPWGSHRAWGVPLLVAPVAAIDATLPVVRLYLVALSSAGLFLAYWPWLRVRDTPVVPLAAGLFATTYVVAYQGLLARPNYYTALGAVAAVAFLLQCRRGAGHRLAPAGLAAALAFTTLVRPSDAVWLVLPLAVAWLGLAAWRSWQVATAIGAGCAAGWAPWIVEAFGRFGGPLARYAAAKHAVGGGLHLDLATVELYVRMWSTATMDCFLTASYPCKPPAPVGLEMLLWGMAAAGLVAAGAVAAVLRRRGTEVLLPLAAGASLAFSYLFILENGSLRFLVPATALLALPAAHGVLLLGQLRIGPRPVRALAAALAAALVAGHVAVNHTTLGEFAPEVSEFRAGDTVLAQRLDELGVAPPCLLIGSSAHTVGYRLGCSSLGRPRRYPAQAPGAVARARQDAAAVVVVLRSEEPPAGSFLAQWRSVRLDGPGGRDWFAYLPPETAPSRS